MLMKAFIILSLKQNIRFTRATNVNFCKSFFPGPVIKYQKKNNISLIAEVKVNHFSLFCFSVSFAGN